MVTGLQVDTVVKETGTVAKETGTVAMETGTFATPAVTVLMTCCGGAVVEFDKGLLATVTLCLFDTRNAAF